MHESPTTFNCKNCGAPLPYKHGENLLHCNYCGATTMLADYDNIVTIAEPFIIPNKFTKGVMMTTCRKWMSEGVFKAADLANKARIIRIETRYLPFWTIYAHATTKYSGTSGGDDVEGSREENVAWVVYARTDPGEFFGFWALNPGAKKTSADWGDFPFQMNLGSEKSEGIDLVTGREPFDQRLVGDIEVVNGQITDDEARAKAENEISAFSRKKIADEVSAVSSFDVSVNVEKAELVYLPLWSVEYGYGRKTYRMLLQGHTGRVLAGEAPVGKWDKVAILGAVCGVTGIAFGAAAYFFTPYLYFGTALMILIVGGYAMKQALSA